MTPEKAQYYWMMLRLGLREGYDRELDRLLREEDPLSPLTLELADSISDVNRTISVLRNHLWARPADQRQVCGLILDDLRRAYLASAAAPKKPPGPCRRSWQWWMTPPSRPGWSCTP